MINPWSSSLLRSVVQIIAQIRQCRICGSEHSRLISVLCLYCHIRVSLFCTCVCVGCLIPLFRSEYKNVKMQRGDRAAAQHYKVTEDRIRSPWQLHKASYWISTASLQVGKPILTMHVNGISVLHGWTWINCFLWQVDTNIESSCRGKCAVHFPLMVLFTFWWSTTGCGQSTYLFTSNCCFPWFSLWFRNARDNGKDASVNHNCVITLLSYRLFHAWKPWCQSVAGSHNSFAGVL